jgi:hypothetical protein
MLATTKRSRVMTFAAATRSQAEAHVVARPEAGRRETAAEGKY